jgi:CHAD domain-containing protein
MERFDWEEGAGAGVARIIAETSDRAVEQLRAGKQPMKRVHDARKRFKEIRAALRLARTGLGKRFADENEWFRAAGHSLAAVRDADAHVAMLEKLHDHAGDDPTHDAIARAAEILTAERDRLEGDALDAHLVRLANELAVHPRLSRWDFGSQRFDTIGEGLELSARTARRAFRQAAKSRNEADFHTWRRRVKDVWYQLRFLEPVNPDPVRERTAKLKELSRLLGDYHDLTTLREVIPNEPLLRALIARRVDELGRTALRFGAEVHAGKPKQLRAQMQRDWEAWRAPAPRFGVSGSSRIETASSARTSERSSTPAVH